MGLCIGEDSLVGLGCGTGSSFSGGGLEEIAGAAVSFLRLAGASVGVFPQDDEDNLSDWYKNPSREVYVVNEPQVEKAEASE